MEIRRTLLNLVPAAALTGALTLVAQAEMPSPRTADLVIVNGHIVTEATANPVVEAIAVRSGRILATGTNEQIRALARRDARVIDLHGRTATPGLIDTHAHLAEGGVASLLAVDLSEASSIADVRRLVAARAATLKPGSWLQGTGWDEGKLAERRYVTAADLDDITPQNPVWLEHTTGHYGVANTAALKLAGIDRTTASPPAGTIDHDASGAPSGVLKEDAKDLVTRIVPEPTASERRQGILANLELMQREGMTGVKDPNISQADCQAYESLAREGKLTAHVCVLWHSARTVEDAYALVKRLAALPKPPVIAAPNLVSCGVKLFMDGSGGARTAWMHDDWHRNSVDVDVGNKGYPATDPAAYRRIVQILNHAGLHVSTHAIGDKAIDWVVDTYEQVLKDEPRKDLRHGIIHANTPTDHALDVMAALQRVYGAGYPETQAEFTWWIGDNYAGNLGPGRAARLNPYQTYLRRGIQFGGGSDYPVTPLAARYGLWASVARTTLRGTYGAQPFGTAESISIADALRTYTTWAAHQLFLDAEAGSLEPGKSADLAVWDQDPTVAPTAALKDLKCELTLFRGVAVYRAADTPVTVTAHR